jgi:hypothetical protein
MVKIKRVSGVDLVAVRICIGNQTHDVFLPAKGDAENQGWEMLLSSWLYSEVPLQAYIVKVSHDEEYTTKVTFGRHLGSSAVVYYPED